MRRRAGRVRSVARALLATGTASAEITGEQVLDDGRVLLRYRVPALRLVRAVALSALEAASLRYVLHRAGGPPPADEDRARVEAALAALGEGLKLDAALLPDLRPR